MESQQRRWLTIDYSDVGSGLFYHKNSDSINTHSFVVDCLHLVKGEAGVAISLENLVDRVDVGGGAKVEPEVVGHSGVHDRAGSPLHAVVEAGVDDVLLGGAAHPRLEVVRRGHRDAGLAAALAEPPLQRVL